MYESDALHRRGQALENEFFHRVDEKLRQQLRDSMRKEDNRLKLAKITGFRNEELLDHLVEQDFDPETIAALALVPIVFVAWADGDVTAAERQAVMHELISRGMDRDCASRRLIEHWLEAKPSRELWKLWKEYVWVLRQTFSPTILEMLGSALHQKAKRIAEVSREGLTFNSISRAEQAVLDEIEQAFQDGSPDGTQAGIERSA